MNFVQINLNVKKAKLSLFYQFLLAFQPNKCFQETISNILNNFWPSLKFSF